MSAISSSYRSFLIKRSLGLSNESDRRQLIDEIVKRNLTNNLYSSRRVSMSGKTLVKSKNAILIYKVSSGWIVENLCTRQQFTIDRLNEKKPEFDFDEANNLAVLYPRPEPACPKIWMYMDKCTATLEKPYKHVACGHGVLVGFQNRNFEVWDYFGKKLESIILPVRITSYRKNENYFVGIQYDSFVLNIFAFDFKTRSHCSFEVDISNMEQISLGNSWTFAAVFGHSAAFTVSADEHKTLFAVNLVTREIDFSFQIPERYGNLRWCSSSAAYTILYLDWLHGTMVYVIDVKAKEIFKIFECLSSYCAASVFDDLLTICTRSQTKSTLINLKTRRIIREDLHPQFRGIWASGNIRGGFMDDSVMEIQSFDPSINIH